MEKILVIHSAFEQEPVIVAEVRNASLEDAFALTQNAHFSWTETPDPRVTVLKKQSRSTSVNDRLVWRDQKGIHAAIVASVGFKQIF
jgi:hypothetical protein